MALLLGCCTGRPKSFKGSQGAGRVNCLRVGLDGQTIMFLRFGERSGQRQRMRQVDMAVRLRAARGTKRGQGFAFSAGTRQDQSEIVSRSFVIRFQFQGFA